MKARPILMSTPMVQATLAGRKTKTRRIIKGKPLLNNGRCPHGNIGDLLWIRETCARIEKDDTDELQVIYKADGAPGAYGLWIIDGNAPSDKFAFFEGPWTPSIFMRRWVSRITLEIINIRVERLQDITEEDAIAEGLEVIEYKGHPAYRYNGGNSTGHGSAKGAYWALWEEINGKGSWKANPWVWVIEFKTHFRNVDEVIREWAKKNNPLIDTGQISKSLRF